MFIFQIKATGLFRKISAYFYSMSFITGAQYTGGLYAALALSATNCSWDCEGGWVG